MKTVRQNRKDVFSTLPGISFDQIKIDEQLNEAVFLSNKPISLYQKPYLSIELFDKNNATPLIPHLPNADIPSLHIKDNKWIAQMFVYI